MSLRITSAFLVTTALFAAGCDEDSERFERIEKLRALGVRIDPLVVKESTPGLVPQVASLTIFVATPLGEDVDFSTYLDEAAQNSFPMPLALDASTATKKDYAKLTLHEIKGFFTPPEAGQVPILPSTGFARLRYAVRATVGAEHEEIVGNSLLYPNTPDVPAYEPLIVTMTAPAEGAPAAGGPLKAELSNPNGDKVRIGWYVSSGKVKNRRARETEWQDPQAGMQTVIVTARGLKTGSFALDVRDVGSP